MRYFDPGVWIDPLGRLWLWWAQCPQDAVRAVICEEPDADELKWSQEFTIGHNAMMNKPIALSSGEWLFPVAVWDAEHGIRVLPPEYDDTSSPTGAGVVKSSDNGSTFVELGRVCVPQRHFDEHMLLEKENGDLLMLVRTWYGIGAAVSCDRGMSWSKGYDSLLGGPCSRFHIRRLRSGRVLLLNHVGCTGYERTNLTALLSDDDGQTWKWQLLLDARSDVSYPDACEDENGNIYIVYDRERGGFRHSFKQVYHDAREILMASITEEDIMAGQLVSDGSYLQRIVSKLGRYANEASNPFEEPCRYSSEELAQRLESKNAQQVLSQLFTDFSANCALLSGKAAVQLDEYIQKYERTPDRKNLIRVIEQMRQVTESGPGQSQPIIDKIKALVQEKCCEEISVNGLAEQLNISSYYMCHLFSQATGTTILNYRNSLRLTKAKQLLVGGREKITDIALRCGFNSTSYFDQIFKREERLTPEEYRTLHRKG